MKTPGDICPEFSFKVIQQDQKGILNLLKTTCNIVKLHRNIKNEKFMIVLFFAQN